MQHVEEVSVQDTTVIIQDHVIRHVTGVVENGKNK
jgi:hypothetical protein